MSIDVHCQNCGATDDLIQAGVITRGKPTLWICRNERACYQRATAQDPKICRDCGTASRLVKHGKAWRCMDYFVCRRNQAKDEHAKCADCTVMCAPHTWYQDRFGRKVCNNRTDCHARRGIAELRGVSGYESTPATTAPIPTDDSDLYSSGPSDAYTGAYRAVKGNS